MTIEVNKLKRLLVAEDESMVAMLLQDRLEHSGYEVTMVSRLDSGITMANCERFDAAVLDINLAGETSFPLADVLDKQGVPILFATGYGVAGLSHKYRDFKTLQKPYDSATLNAALADLFEDADPQVACTPRTTT